MENQELQKLFIERLKNMITRYGDDNVFDLSIQLMESIEKEFNIEITEHQASLLDEITENYVDLF